MILHVYPEAEEEAHQRAGLTCTCLPRLELRNASTIVVHRGGAETVSREAWRPPAPFTLPLDPAGE